MTVHTLLPGASLDSLKTRSRRFLARKRQSLPVRTLHRFATFIEEAYENEEWDMCANGETNVLSRLAGANFHTAFDVGAHVGLWSKEALNRWPGCQIHAFEVAPPTFDRLKHHLDVPGYSSRVTLNCHGLGDATGSREMYYFADHPHLTCDSPRHPYSSMPFVASLVRGDEYLERHRIAEVGFMKIDVEGTEHLVLRGLSRHVESSLIDCIQFEYGAFSVQTRILLADYYAMLASRYWIGKIFPTHVEFRDYAWTMESFRFANFLCVARRRPDLKALVA
jgi:FkbM family methyltransferase